MIGLEWAIGEIGELTDNIVRKSPVEFNEENRYLPESVTPVPGYIRYSVTPYMREIVNCFDMDSPVREVNLKKGVQVTYTTAALEAGMFYCMAWMKTLPMMYVTADKELADARIENNILPMLQHSGFSDIIRSSDAGNSRKTGKTKHHLQFAGGGYLLPYGANNAGKMRQASIAVLLKDELDGWPDVVGKDGDPDKLTDDRCSAYWERRKIFRGSTPLLAGSSKIDFQFHRGDQRVYRVTCQGSCNKPMVLRWKYKGGKGGFMWETADDQLVFESVRFVCPHCGHEHFEHDKPRLFAEEHGAHWHPTATPVEPFIRSYHLPAFYSPLGMQPWTKCVAAWLDAWDERQSRVKDVRKLQVFYNNVLAEPFQQPGYKITPQQAWSHRRAVYGARNVPNRYALKHCGSSILMLTAQVDVHKDFLAVAVIGWTRGMRSFVVEYKHVQREEKELACSEVSSPVWGKLRGLIEDFEYEADDGRKYRIFATVIDAGYATDTVVAFCSDYDSNVYPIVGRERPANAQRIQEFGEFKTQAGTTGYRITVDHYKDRLSEVLRREWVEEAGMQPEYHFNAPADMTDDQLRELTVEFKREETNERGVTSYRWHRPNGARNELWDLLVYGHALVEIVAWKIWREHFEQETINWQDFWIYVEREAAFFSAVSS